MEVGTTLTDFANSTSLHGVPRIINSRSLCYRSFWALICIGAFLVFAWSASNLLNQYFSYPKKVNVEVNLKAVPFPAVTVCNMDHLDMVSVERLERMFSDENQTREKSPEYRAFLDRYKSYSEQSTYFTGFYMKINDSTVKERSSDMLQYTSRVGLAANLGLNLSSKAGVSPEDFIVSCRFMDDDCDITASFVKVFDPYYFNCYTFQPQVILQSRSTRLSGVEYGLSLLLFSGSAGQLSSSSGDSRLELVPGMLDIDPALANGEGARIVVHSPDTLPSPKADGFDVPSGFSVTLGVKARQNERIGRPHGNCTKTDRGNSTYIYTLVSCQNQCIQRRIMEMCKCIDIQIEMPQTDNNRFYRSHQAEHRSITNSLRSMFTDALHKSSLFRHSNRTQNVTKDGGRKEGGGRSKRSSGWEGGEGWRDYLPYCLQLPELPEECQHMTLEDEKLEDINPTCIKIAREFNEKMKCRRRVFEEMTLGQERFQTPSSPTDEPPTPPYSMDSCECYPPCSDVTFDVSYSLSMLPYSSKEHNAFYLRVDHFIASLDDERKKILHSRHGANSTEDSVRRLIARLNVYIADSNVITTSESADYDLIRLVSDLGGQLGLWIGVSIITLVEVLQLGADVIRVLFVTSPAGRKYRQGGCNNRREGERVERVAEVASESEGEGVRVAKSKNGQLCALIENQNTRSRDHNNGSRDDNSRSRDDNTRSRDDNTRSRDDNSRSRDDNRSHDDDNIWLRHDNNGSRDDNIWTRDDKIRTRDTNPEESALYEINHLT